MVKPANRQTRQKVAAPRPRKAAPKLNGEMEHMLRAATIHLIREHGGLLVATSIREELTDGCPKWVITVTLRYPTGHEGYVGDLLYDGTDFSFLTPLDVRKERIKEIAADPEGIRLWNEYRASTLRSTKA